jgi:triosephosphate isomerase
VTAIIILNFKTYKESTGENAVKLAKIADEVARKAGDVSIFVAVQPSDIAPVAKSVKKIHVLAQHVDAIEFGKNTGYLLPEDALEAGAVGTLLNHSEHQLSMEELAASIKRCREVGLTSFVFGTTPNMLAKIAVLKPDAVVIEPPELVGGKVSVTSAKPAVITKSVDIVRKITKIPVLCGAGIKDRKDVTKAIQLGAEGIAVASGFVLAKKPMNALIDLVIGAQNGQNTFNP